MPSLVTERVCKTCAFGTRGSIPRLPTMRPWSIGRASECHSDDASSILAGRTIFLHQDARERAGVRIKARVNALVRSES